jgi:hypothetical protein
MIMVKNRIFIFFALTLGCTISALPRPVQSESQDIASFVSQLKIHLENKNIAEYLESFLPEYREQEEIRIRSYYDDFQMDSLSIFPASQQKQSDLRVHVYLQALFQNPYSVMLNLWRYAIERGETGWYIDQVQSLGQPRVLYKLRLPTDRTLRARSVEVKHQDISIIFRNAVCFFDNLPDLDTALILVGEGRVHFAPSHPREQHQLDLVYNKPYVEDRLEYLYLRMSPSFFKTNIFIDPEEDEADSVSQAEINKAYSLFTKHYSRSFTVRNSLTEDLFSVLPQGQEAILEFKGRKIGDITYVYSPFSQEEINFYQWKKERVLNLYSPSLADGQKRLFISFGQKYDVIRYDIELDFNPDQYFFAGKAKVRVEAKVGQLDSLKFKLNPNLQILRVRDESNRELYYTEDKLRDTVYIYFLQPYARGQTATMEIYYRGKIEPPPVSTDVIRTSQITERISFSNLRLDTLLYSRSSYWYPAPDEVDYFTARIKIITPPDFSVISNGTLVEQYSLQNLENVEDVGTVGHSVIVYETQKPVKYLSFVVGRLSLREQSQESVLLNYYRGSQTMPENWDIFSGAREILEYFETLFGEFPFEKLSIIRRVWVSTGGHSPASFIVLNDLPELIAQNMRPVPNSPVDLSNWREYFLAHELAHQWWGQGVAGKSYRDQWLSEGMAQFAAIRFLRQKYGEKTYSQILEKFSKGIVKKSKWGGITMGSRISFFDFEAYQTIVYNKAALVLNMLQDMLGEETFSTCLRRFYNRHKYSVATTPAFFHFFKDIAPMDLTVFFDQWFNSHLLPAVSITHTTGTAPDGFRLQVSVTQTGTKFVFPLWVEWKEEGQTVRRQMLVAERTVAAEFKTSVRPHKIKINPDKAVPGKFSIQ